MKTLKIFSLISLLSILLFSCDKIEGPYTENNNGGVIPTDSVVRKVLLEDFTGHRCPNCPAAAAIAHQIETLYPGRVSIIGIHAGSFAKTISPKYTANYICSESEELFSHYGIETVGNPNGLVNRKDFSGSKIVSPTDWASKIAELLATPADANIKINKSYIESSKTLTLDINVDFFKDFENEIKFCAYLTESGMISSQKDGTNDISDYVHNHVLRASMNSVWGNTLSDGVNSGKSYQKTINYQITNTTWKPENMHVVVFVYDASSEEIIQCEEISLI